MAAGRALLLAPLLFYAVYGGVSAQYLIWVVPIAIIIRDRFVVPFTAIAATAIIPFYLLYAPGILFGRHPGLTFDRPSLFLIYLVANVLLVALCIAWLAAIVIGEARAYRSCARATPVGLVARLRPIWSSQLYLIGVGGLALLWLFEFGHAVSRARAVMTVLFP